MNLWLMKSYKDWADLFVQQSESAFVAIDEEGIDMDYGSLTEGQRDSLFHHLQQSSTQNQQFGLIKRFFDDFYENMQVGDLVVLGVGPRTQFNVSAFLQIQGPAYYRVTNRRGHPKHRRDAKIIWKGRPRAYQKWGFSRRLEPLNTLERYKEFIELYTSLH